MDIKFKIGKMLNKIELVDLNFQEVVRSVDINFEVVDIYVAYKTMRLDTREQKTSGT